MQSRAMKGGRKNLKRASKGNDTFTPLPGQTIMQVVSLRGSNLIEVMDAKGDNSLALFPAKFQKSMWIKIGNYVVVDDSGREEAIGSGRKVGCIVSQVLYHEQVRVLQKSPEWESKNPRLAGTRINNKFPWRYGRVWGKFSFARDRDGKSDSLLHREPLLIEDLSFYINFDACSFSCVLHWPAIFRSTSLDVSSEVPKSCDADNELNSSDDDGLPPLEANTNRTRPAGLQTDTESDSDADEA